MLPRLLALAAAVGLAAAGCSTTVAGRAVDDASSSSGTTSETALLPAPQVPTTDPDAIAGYTTEWYAAVCAQGTYRPGTTLTHVTNGGSCTSVVDPGQTLFMARTTLDEAEQAALYDELYAVGTTFSAGALDGYGLQLITTSASTQDPLAPLLEFGFRIDPF